MQKKEEDTLANEPDIPCGVCGVRCNGTVHLCHGEHVHGYCLDESDHRTCKKCKNGDRSKCDSSAASVSNAATRSSNSDNDPPSFLWTGQTSASSQFSKEDVTQIIEYRVLEEKQFTEMTDLAIRRLKNPADKSDMAFIRDLIGHHFKGSVIAQLDSESIETHMLKVDCLSQSSEFRRGFLWFQRSVKSVADARPFPCIIVGRNR